MSDIITYTHFGAGDIVPNIKQVSTSPVWSNGSGSLTTFYTSSAQSASSGDYYYDVYDQVTSSATSEVQFAITYGHRFGSGSTPINDDAGDDSLTPSRAIYSQYRNFLLNKDVEQFTVNDVNIDHILVINFNRARVKQKLDPDNWELTIRTSEGHHTFIDDSTVNTSPSITEGGTYYNIVSGSITNGVYNTTDVNYYGLVWPEHSVLIFDPDALADTPGLIVDSSSDVNADNHGNFYRAISASATEDSDFAFKARNEEEIRSTYYFTRIKNGDYNFSTNPSFYTGSLGKLRNTDMVNDSQTYITTVGLYNDDNELLAIAKMSKALKKNFHREALLRLKLDF